MPSGSFRPACASCGLVAENLERALARHDAWIPAASGTESRREHPGHSFGIPDLLRRHPRVRSLDFGTACFAARQLTMATARSGCVKGHFGRIEALGGLFQKGQGAVALPPDR